MDTLYQSENLLVRRVACADRSRWVITFDNHSIGAGFDRPGFSEAVLQARGISAIHILGRGDDWYQYPDIRKACRAARVATRQAARRVAYGSSMGGYAALRLANKVRADAVLALSPQYSNDPGAVPWETRWEADAARIDWQEELGGPLRCRCRPIVIYDPAGPDQRHVDLIARDVQATLLPIRYGGHPVASLLAEVGLLRPILQRVVDGSFDAAAVAANVRERRSRSSIYLCELAERQPPSRARLAANLARRAAEVHPDGLLGTLTLARIVGQSGRHAEALDLHERTVRESGRQERFLIPYAEALIAAGKTRAAVPVAREVQANQPDKAYLRHWLAWVLLCAGDRREAVRLERAALELAPGTSRYREALRVYESPIRSLLARYPRVRRMLIRIREGHRRASLTRP